MWCRAFYRKDTKDEKRHIKCDVPLSICRTNPWEIELVSDAAAHTVTLQINDEAVYVHPVK